MSGAFPLSHPLHRSRTLPKFLMARRETQAFVCTGLSATPEQILLWFPQCSSLEATFLGRKSPFGGRNESVNDLAWQSGEPRLP